MKKILSNPAAFFMLIVLIVTICVVSIPFIVHFINDLNTKSFFDDHYCCVCGAEAANYAECKYYCTTCFNNKYGDLPIYHGLS